MNTNGNDLTKCMIPKTIEDLTEECKLLAGALYKLMSNIPNCYVQMSACNETGESLYIDIHATDAEGRDIKIDKCRFEFYGPNEWRDTFEYAKEEREEDEGQKDV